MISGLNSVFSKRIDTNDYQGEGEMIEGTGGKKSQKKGSFPQMSSHHNHLEEAFSKN